MFHYSDLDLNRPTFDPSITPNLDHEQALKAVRLMGYEIIATRTEGDLISFDARIPGLRKLYKGPYAPSDKAMAALLSYLPNEHTGAIEPSQFQIPLDVRDKLRQIGSVCPMCQATLYQDDQGKIFCSYCPWNEDEVNWRQSSPRQVPNDMQMELPSTLTEEELFYARDWLKDLEFINIEPEDIDDMSDSVIIRGIQKYYGGGLEQFILDNNPHGSMELTRQFTSGELIPYEVFKQKQNERFRNEQPTYPFSNELFCPGCGEYTLEKISHGVQIGGWYCHSCNKEFGDPEVEGVNLSPFHPPTARIRKWDEYNQLSLDKQTIRPIEVEMQKWLLENHGIDDDYNIRYNLEQYYPGGASQFYKDYDPWKGASIGDNLELIPCPMNIPIEPERIIEYPDWTPNEEPLVIPEEWPEEVPEENPEEEEWPEEVPEEAPEKEPAKVGKISAELPHYYNPEPGFGWKILKVLDDGTLMSPSQGTEWPVGQPLVEPNFQVVEQIRSQTGIHTVEEGNWGELYHYTNSGESFVLVKCQLFGQVAEQPGVGHLSGKAMPILAIGIYKDILLRVANKYGIDTHLVEGAEESQIVYKEYDDGETPEEMGWTIRTQDQENSLEYKGFSFSISPSTSRIYSVFNPDGEDYGSFTYDSHTEEVTNMNVIDFDAIDIVKNFFDNKRSEQEDPHWSRNCQPDIEDDEDPYVGDYREEVTINDWENLLKLNRELNGGGYESFKYTEPPEIESDDYAYYLWPDPDEYGLKYWVYKVTYYQPTEIKFDSEIWIEILDDTLKAIYNEEYGPRDPELYELTQALIEVPKFMADDETFYQQWDQDPKQLFNEGIYRTQDIIRTQDAMGNNNPVAQEFLEQLEGLVGVPVHPNQMEMLYKEDKPDYTQYYPNSPEMFYPDPYHPENIQGLSKTADYFYDWQGYYPDDGSLEDGRINPSAPAPAFINAPNRCPHCGEGVAPGHLINTDEYEKQDVLHCQKCQKPLNGGYAYPMEYDEIGPMHSPWNVLNKTAEWEDTDEHREYEHDEDEPLEEDAYINYDNSVVFNGKSEGQFDSYDEALAAIKELMEEQQYWPNIWFVSDHGNYHQLTGDSLKTDDDQIFDQAQINWPNTLPWGESEQDYYRNSKYSLDFGKSHYRQLWRGMTDKEYKRWANGEVIGAGKYFTAQPRLFYVNPKVLRQTSENTFRLIDHAQLVGENMVEPLNQGLQSWGAFNEDDWSWESEEADTFLSNDNEAYHRIWNFIKSTGGKGTVEIAEFMRATFMELYDSFESWEEQNDPGDVNLIDWVEIAQYWKSRYLEQQQYMDTQKTDTTFPENWLSKIAEHEDEMWPLVYEQDPWRFEWNGGRLMEIYHRNNPSHAVEGIQATDYDFNMGKPLYSNDPYGDMVERAQNWINEYADNYEQEIVPYMYRDENSEQPNWEKYPGDYFPEDWKTSGLFTDMDPFSDMSFYTDQFDPQERDMAISQEYTPPEIVPFRMHADPEHFAPFNEEKDRYVRPTDNSPTN